MHGIAGWAVALLVSVLGACMAPEPFVQEAVQAQQAQPPEPPPDRGQCPEFGCGENSPIIDALGVYELSTTLGLISRQGFTIEPRGGVVPIIKGGVTYQLHVIDGKISGTRIGMPTLAGNALRDAWIPVRHPRGRYVLVIRGVRPMRYFLEPRALLEAYTVEWRFENDDRRFWNICSDVEGLTDERRRDPEGSADHLLGMDVAETLIYEGDRYDAVRKTTDVFADDQFFTIACAGHTLSKLRLTHNTVHGQQAPAPAPRTWERRQATMKMLVADYCKNGTAFTVAGQKLAWRGDAMVNFFRAPRSLEAWWSERGAECLNEPRMTHPTTPLGLSMYPDPSVIWTDIATVCAPPPPCPNPDPYAIVPADRVSANPRL
jgi:hypothetical protein